MLGRAGGRADDTDFTRLTQRRAALPAQSAVHLLFRFSLYFSKLLHTHAQERQKEEEEEITHARRISEEEGRERKEEMILAGTVRPTQLARTCVRAQRSYCNASPAQALVHLQGGSSSSSSSSGANVLKVNKSYHRVRESVCVRVCVRVSGEAL